MCSLRCRETREEGSAHNRAAHQCRVSGLEGNGSVTKSLIHHMYADWTPRSSSLVSILLGMILPNAELLKLHPYIDPGYSRQVSAVWRAVLMVSSVDWSDDLRCLRTSLSQHCYSRGEGTSLKSLRLLLVVVLQQARLGTEGIWGQCNLSRQG